MINLPSTSILSLMVALMGVASGLTPEIKELELKHRVSINSPEGKAYEKIVVSNFWGDAKFLKKCVPSDSPSPSPFRIYFEVFENGKMGKLIFLPETNVTKCIRKNVENRKFPKPPYFFVQIIQMNFK